MIANTEIETSELPAWINLGRPDLFNDEDRAWWKRIHDCIKTCEVPIFVNGMFDSIDKMIENKQSYGGGGFAYKFWFETEADRSSFIRLLISDCGVGVWQIKSCEMHPPLGALT